ncbi:Osmotin thaumatin-like protein [Lactarius quietus]|nr:Osmotin thaumatin-like protein [Lactarius quietus]
MKVYIPLLLSASPFLTTTIARTLSVANNCPYTIWYLHTDSATVPSHQPTGWLAPPGSNISFTVPDNWVGQIWGRRDCNFTTNPGADSCLDGGCPGGLLCTGQGQSPVTVAQLRLTSDTGVSDYYEISLINGFNVPMRINNNANCGVPECSVDLGANCNLPAEGFPTGCNSACAAGLAADPNNDPNCCTGTYDDTAVCLPSGVQYYNYFKSNCPDAYVYTFDTVESNPPFICPEASKADYAVTFCSKKD